MTAKPGTGGMAIRVGGWDELGAAARAVRFAVFVDEQGIDPELELDARDATAVHAVAYDADGVPVGTARLLPDAHIGRMAVLARARGTGIGAALLQRLIDVAAGRGMRELRLHAQSDAVGFYARAGFEADGDEYLEAGIRHRTMRRALAEGDRS
jgi:predicted GNAT family N-acyltransferase